MNDVQRSLAANTDFLLAILRVRFDCGPVTFLDMRALQDLIDAVAHRLMAEDRKILLDILDPGPKVQKPVEVEGLVDAVKDYGEECASTFDAGPHQDPLRVPGDDLRDAVVEYLRTVGVVL